MAPPSVHASGKRYRWRDGHGPHELKPAPLPDWLRMLLFANWQPNATPRAAGNRPGDEFNRRGDVPELLMSHDWRRCRTGANEHWTRPGKPDGTSATLKERVLFVFSTNAPPFEANEAYSPFAIFALLECGGDYEQAARELGRRGFGANTTPPQADDSAVTLGPIPPFVPFPLHTLPAALARFVRETAAALGCEPTYVALPALCVTAAAIGTTRAIELKGSWKEYAILWAGVVARSGTLKSPAFDAAVKPLRDAQIDALRAYEAAADEYERELLKYESDRKDWLGNKDGAPPMKPKPPTLWRVIYSDTTIEALAPNLEANPRGGLLARDELAGWVRGFDAYKAKGRGGDVAAWLETWRAGTLIVDRKTGDKRTIYVPLAAMSVCGTIQPGVLAGVLTAEHFENGLAARLLLAQPPELQKRWSDRTPSPAALRGYENLIHTLLALEHIKSERGPEPICLPLSVEARALWAEWYNRHAQRIGKAGSDREAAALAKIEAYAARFALIFALSVNPDARDVSAEAMRRGVALADWFAGESARVYGLLAESDDAKELRHLAEWIGRQGGSATPRAVARCLRAYPKPADAEAALDRLVQAGMGEWTSPPPGARGGRPTRVFRLFTPKLAENAEHCCADETPADEHAEGVSSASAVSVGAPDGSTVDQEWGEL